MANTISSLAESIQFFGAELLVQLRNQLALIGLVNRNYQGAVAASGQTINIPSLSITGTANTRAINGAVTVDDMASQNVAVTMQQVYKSVKLDNLQQTFSNVDLMMAAAQRLAIIMADGVDALLTALWFQIPYEVGKTDGTATFNATDKMNVFAAARKQLMLNKAPVDRLQAVVGPTEAYNLRTLDLFNQALQSGSAEQRQTGDLGRVAGFALHESQATPTNITLSTAAQWATPLIGAAGAAIGATSIPVKGLQVSQTPCIKKGSIFVHNSNNYVVTADANSDAGGLATVFINPPLKSAAVNNDVITVTNYTHSAAGSVGFAFDPDAFLLVVRPQASFVPGAGVYQETFSDPVSGLEFRLNIEAAASGAGGTAMQQVLTCDLLAGAALVRPELACRIAGQV
jgi:hypothetical protein